MAGNTFGTLLKMTTFGESHGTAIGVTIDGCPAGLPLSIDDLKKDLSMRKPIGLFETARCEEDIPEILSGVFEGKTLGTPITVYIRNTDMRPHNYDTLRNVYRPGHADFTYEAKYGLRDWRGGGRASGRETAARIAAGTVANKILTHCAGSVAPITIETAAVEIAGIPCLPVRIHETLPEIINEKLQTLSQAGDSAGAILRCTVKNVPTGLGEPVFDKLDAEIAKAVLSVGGIKGISFGAGFALTGMTGSEANIITENHYGGISGGISCGTDIVFHAAVKPVPSISQPQKAITKAGEQITLSIKGRHDVCLYRRMIPVINAMTAFVFADMLLRQKALLY